MHLIRTGPRAFLGVLLSVLAAWQQPPSPVRVDALRKESVEERRQVTGTLRAAQRAQVATREAGVILELLAREGQALDKGAVIARLDGRLLALELLVLRAEQETARAVLAEQHSEQEIALRDLEALRALGERGAANPKELTDAQARAASAKARVAAAESGVAAATARIELTQKRLSDMEVTAPFAGSVVRRLAQAGEYLAQGAAVVELVSTQDLEAWLELPQQHWTAATRQASEVEVSVDAAGQSVVVALERVVGDIDARARTFAAIAKIPPQAGFAPGMSVSGWIVTGAKSQEWTVARDAILRNATGAYVYVAAGMPDGQFMAMPQPVEVLFQVGTRVVVRGPTLVQGQKVVIEGNERLFPGAPIAPISSP